jgi:hypothetical protein
VERPGADRALRCAAGTVDARVGRVSALIPSKLL